MRRSCWLLVLLVACGDGDVVVNPPEETELQLALVTGGLEAPLFLTAPAGDDRLFVVEQAGTIRIIEDGALLPEPFLDLRDRVLDGGERGLLGLAFHPSYATNGFFFVNYTDNDGDTRIERYAVTGNADVADPASATLVLAIDQPFANHNGGMLAFAPDGTLWIGTGDGGGSGDPDENGQNPAALLGKILRIDVDGATPYGVPADNPFVGQAGARPEVWAYGLRNPWRFSFDPQADQVYVADVGQNSFEEINRVGIEDAAVNYGWNVMEGTHCFLELSCDATGLELPILEYDHDDGCSVIGGYVYRGSALPTLAGHYFYGDFCGGWIRSVDTESVGATGQREWDLGEIGDIRSFGVDAAGDLYVLTDLQGDGRVWRFVPAS